MAKVHDQPLTRRFHRRRGERLKRWEVQIWNALFAKEPSIRLWANVLADGLYTIYRSRHRRLVEADLEWLCDTATGSMLKFNEVAAAFDIEPDDVRRDVLEDVRAGKIAFQGRLLGYAH